MSQVINISDEEIGYAEKILLPSGKHFNDERKNYIRNFETIDLQAVPGSGKTTALLAKLIILENKLPFEDGSGILVLSHTNAAINEIKDKLNACTRIFSYPNFIGTIQSFVDEFLAIPNYVQSYKRKPARIDNEIFEEIAGRIYKNLPNSAAKTWLNQKYEPEQYFVNLRFDTDLNLREGIHGQICLKSESNSNTYRHLKGIKCKILENGFLNFDDAYFFAEMYYKKYPEIKRIIQNRFSYVFVDEMQDMDTHQHDLLEKLFYDDGNSISRIQRIGDRNQSIYSTVRADDIWHDRENILRLSESIRLSSPIASVVSNFALYRGDDYVINGINECSLNPHILIFDDSTLTKVIPFFSNLVKTYNEEGKLPDFHRYPIKAIAWNTEWKVEADKNNREKIRLIDYCQKYSKANSNVRHDFSCLKSYLIYYDKNKKTLESVRKNILNAILKVLRLENIYFRDDKPFTKKILLEELKIRAPQLYENFLHNLYTWSIGIIRGDTENVITEIRSYLPSFYFFTGKALSESLPFINGEDEQIQDCKVVSAEEMNNFFEMDGVSIEIASVHAVKGQTHCATLYLESFFDRGYGNYESERLRNQFLTTQTVEETIASIPTSHDKVKQSAKMAFVGFSRPTNLLCVAIHKNRFNAVLNAINREIWEVIEIPIKQPDQSQAN